MTKSRSSGILISHPLRLYILYLNTRLSKTLFHIGKAFQIGIIPIQMLNDQRHIRICLTCQLRLLFQIQTSSAAGSLPELQGKFLFQDHILQMTASDMRSQLTEALLHKIFMIKISLRSSDPVKHIHMHSKPLPVHVMDQL